MSGTLSGLLLALAPLLPLVVLLLLGRYPGEQSIERARVAVDRLLARAASVRVPRFRLPQLPGSVRGGRLIADSLAGRGPPFAG